MFSIKLTSCFVLMSESAKVCKTWSALVVVLWSLGCCVWVVKVCWLVPSLSILLDMLSPSLSPPSILTYWLCISVMLSLVLRIHTCLGCASLHVRICQQQVGWTSGSLMKLTNRKYKSNK